MDDLCGRHICLCQTEKNTTNYSMRYPLIFTFLMNASYIYEYSFVSNYI